MLGYIYRYRNKVNSKVYIGQTINLDRRKREHINDANRGSTLAFHSAIRKYGIDNFEFEVLHTVSGDENYVHIRLDELECKEILCHQSYTNGYNETMGGTTGNHLQGKDYKQLHTHICIVCEEVYRNKRKNSRFCSGKCEQKWRRANGVNLVESTCKECGKTIMVDKYSPNNFCSYSCSNKWNHRNVPHFSRRK